MGSAWDPTRGPALPTLGCCQQHPLFLCHMCGGAGGAVEWRGPGRIGPEERTQRGKSPRWPLTHHCGFLRGPSCSQTGAHPRAGWGHPPVLEGWGCEGLVVRGKRGGTCWGSPGRAPSGQGKAGRRGPQSHLFLLTLAQVGGADRLFTRVHELQDRLSAPTCLWVLAQGGGCYRDSDTSPGQWGDSLRVGVGPDQEGPGVLAPNPTFQSSCQAAQPQGRQWLHFLKNLCLVKD